MGTKFQRGFVGIPTDLSSDPFVGKVMLESNTLVSYSPKLTLFRSKIKSVGSKTILHE
ncbi:hypothetical protein LEP1GSC051_2639 [Leptospira sp. P2653]|nr:hypothetical protein LEP1GSC051_2639 [Leptospira sp. P2653]